MSAGYPFSSSQSSRTTCRTSGARSTAAPFVLVVRGDVAQKTPVKLGARGADVVEVAAGLAEGDVVVTDARVKADARVRSPR